MKFQIMSSRKNNHLCDKLHKWLDYIYTTDNKIGSLVDNITSDIPINIFLMDKYNVEPVFGKAFELNMIVVNLNMFNKNYNYYDELLMFIVLHEMAHLFQGDYFSDKRYSEDEADTFAMNVMDKYHGRLGLNKMEYKTHKIKSKIDIETVKVYSHSELMKDINDIVSDDMYRVYLKAETFYIQTDDKIFFHNVLMLQLYRYIMMEKLKFTKLCDNGYKLKSSVKKVNYVENITKSICNVIDKKES